MQFQHWYRTLGIILVAGIMSLTYAGKGTAEVQPGTVITRDTMTQAMGLLTPSMQWFVRQGMPIKVVPYKKVELPKIHKEATEKYSGQVKLSADGKDIINYVAGLPFPKVDANDPLAAYKKSSLGSLSKRRKQQWGFERNPWLRMRTRPILL
jgi:hypothetical protein